MFLLLIHYFMPCPWPLTPWPWHLTFNLEHLQRIVCDVMKLCTNLNAIEQSSAELLRFQCLTLWPWTCFKCCARLLDNFHLVWPSTTYPCLNYSVFNVDMLCQAVTLTFVLLTLKVRGTSSVTWSKSVRNLSEIEQSPTELLIILLIFAHVMSRRDLDIWPLDLELLQHFGSHVFKLCTRLSYIWFSTFSRAVLGWVGGTNKAFSGVRGPIHQTRRDIGRSLYCRHKNLKKKQNVT